MPTSVGHHLVRSSAGPQLIPSHNGRLHAYGTLPCELCAAKAIVYHASVHVRGVPSLTIDLGLLCFWARAVVEVWPVCLNDGVLHVEEQVLLVHSSGSYTSPDLGSLIVHGVPVEIAAMTIMVRLPWHGKFDVDVVAFPGFVPPVD